MKKIGSLLTTAFMLSALLMPVCALKVNATVYRPSPQRTVVQELPDANAPGAPAVVTVQQDDGPTTYVRSEDPENPNEFAYIPEDEVPLANADGLQENNEEANANVPAEDPAAVAAVPAKNTVKTVVAVSVGVAAVGAVGGGIAVATGVIGAGAAGAGASAAGTGAAAAGKGAAAGKNIISRLLKNLFMK